MKGKTHVIAKWITAPILVAISGILSNLNTAQYPDAPIYGAMVGGAGIALFVAALFESME